MTTNSQLNVLHLVTSKEIFFRQQIEALESKGITCTICVVPGGEQIDGAMPKKRGIKEYLIYLLKVRRQLRNGNFDLIHANYGLTAPFALTQFTYPVILTLWGSDVVGLDGRITKLFAGRADAITVRSEEMQELLGIEDVHIIPSGIDLDRFYPIERSQAREYLSWDEDQLIVLFPYAPDYERKNFPLAKRVVNQAETELQTKVTIKTISDVAHSEMVYYYNASNVVLLTSKYEGSPNTVKEALACNIPIISTDVGDVHKRLQDVNRSHVGQTETELVDRLVEVLKINQRTNGREIVTELSWDNIGDSIIDIYYSVLE